MLGIKPYSFAEDIISLENISRRIGNNLIFRNITIDIKNVVRPDITQGQVVVILGPSGIGKTQLFRVMAGLEEPTLGQVYVGPEKKPIRVGQVGVVFQNYPIDLWLTVIEMLIRAGEQSGLNVKQAKEKAISLLEQFGIAERQNFYPSQLSGGQRQRVAIIEQLMCSEHILLMDEPFTGLDYKAKQDACELIESVVQDTADNKYKERNTIVIITHDIETGIEIGDWIWFMGYDRDAEGKIVPGARIVETIDLKERNMAWHPGIQFTNEFTELVKDIKARFCDPRGPYVK